MFDSDGTDMVNGYTSSIIVDYGASVDGYVTVAGSCDFTLGDDPWDQSAAQAAAAQTAENYDYAVSAGQYFALTGTSSSSQMCKVTFSTPPPSAMPTPPPSAMPTPTPTTPPTMYEDRAALGAASAVFGRSLTLAAMSITAAALLIVT